MTTIEWETARPGQRMKIVIAIDVDKDEYKPQEAFASGVPGLVVHEDDRPESKHYGWWGVTHARTGLALGFYAKEPEQAIAFAHAVSSVDWTQSGAEVVRAGKALDVHSIGRAMGLEPGFNIMPTPKDLW